MVVDDVEAMAKTLWDERVPFVSPGVIELNSGDFTKAFTVRDPDGHVLLLQR